MPAWSWRRPPHDSLLATRQGDGKVCRITVMEEFAKQPNPPDTVAGAGGDGGGRAKQTVASDDRFRLMVEASPNAIIMADAGGQIVIANQKAEELFGYSREELAGQPVEILVPERVRRQHVDDRAGFTTHPEARPMGAGRDLFARRKDGREVPVEIGLTPIESPGGVLTLATVTDITARKEAEEARRESELFVAKVLDCSLNGLYVYDFDRRINVFINRRYTELTGYTLDDLNAMSGAEFLALFHPDDAERVAEHMERVIRAPNGEILELEYRFRKKDGGWMWCRSGDSVFERDPDGSVRQFIGTFVDITNRKRADEEVRRLNRQLEARVAERTRQLSEKNQMLEEGLRLAREFQLALLPHRLPVIPKDAEAGESAVRFLTFYRPWGMVSGDYYDVVQLSDHAVGVLLCDVMGHDVRAALVTSMLRTLVQERGPDATDPGALLRQINRSMVSMFTHAGTTMFVTAIYMVVDLARGELLFANAGHPNPLRVHRRRGTVETLEANGRRGPALGLIANADYPTCRVPIEPADFVMLFTDGLFEIENPVSHESFCRRRLFEAARQRASLPANEIFDGLLSEIRRFSHATEFSDDVCLLGLELHPEAESTG